MNEKQGCVVDFRNGFYWDNSAFTLSAHIKRFLQAVVRRVREEAWIVMMNVKEGAFRNALLKKNIMGIYTERFASISIE